MRAHAARVQRVVAMVGGRVTEAPGGAAAGAIVGVVGVDKYLAKSGTLAGTVNTWPMRGLT